MTAYYSPGVYVKEVASGSAPIAGVGTSTAGFIGLIESFKASENQLLNTQTYDMGSSSAPIEIGTGDGGKTEFELRLPEDIIEYDEIKIVEDSYKFFAPGERTSLSVETRNKKLFVVFGSAPDDEAQVSGYYTVEITPSSQEIDDDLGKDAPGIVIPSGEIKLCTNFTEFKKAFGDFSADEAHSNLAHAVYGFFRNGGTRCFVTWIADTGAIDSALESFAAIDEIALVAAPGVTDKAALGKIDAHCQDLGDRFAIFDSPEDAAPTGLKPGEGDLPGASDYVALYYPWIEVFDPATDALKYVPPSGHIAGVYARVDTQRGVHKAPANEVILGATGLQSAITKAKQDGLNPQGVNCIRSLNGNIRIWGARTWGAGVDKPEFKYINIRRLFNYLRESIDEGTQWTVFEPNSPELWAKIRRNVSAFLTMTWRSGALFGSSPEEAFFVKCDEETNPPEVRDAGQVVTVIGVAVVKPAEFVIFEMSQWAGPGGS